jgi:hypothetical protein
MEYGDVHEVPHTTRNDFVNNETYWLNKSDAEFVTSIVEKYGNTTRAETEQETGTNLDDSVYEITIVRHDRNASHDDDFEAGLTTLRLALLADAKRRDAQPSEAGSWIERWRDSE